MNLLSTLRKRWRRLPGEARRFVVVYFVLGLVTAVGYSVFPLDVGCMQCQPIPAAEGWRRGLTWPYISGGALLMGIALAVGWGWTGLRWAVLFWFPVVFGLAYLNGVWQGAWPSSLENWLALAFISIVLFALEFKPLRQFPSLPDPLAKDSDDAGP